MKTNTNPAATIATGFLFMMTLVSCQSHEQSPDAFDQLKEQKMDLREKEMMSSALNLDSSKKENVSENKNQDEWAIFKTETESKILANEEKIKQIKSTPNANTQVLKQVAGLEKSNNDLRRQLDIFKEEEKANRERFKTNLNEDVNKIGIELKDITLNNK